MIDPSVPDETTAVILVDHGSRRDESNRQLLAVADSFRQSGRFSIVEPAHMELAEPSISDAFQRCVEQGAERVLVFPFFLFPGRHWHDDIPRLSAKASRESGDVPFLVAAPLGNHPLMTEIIRDRLDRCSRAAVDPEIQCEECVSRGRCTWSPSA